MDKEGRNEPTGTHVVLTEGAMVPPYRIIRQIGVGGMGEVYLADDTRLNRRVAIKFLPIHLASKEDVKNRFYREAQSVAKLNHPNIVTIHDVSEFHGRPYFVMEHIEGESLHHYAHDEPLPLDKIIEYAIQISQGLGEAHRAGIIHRDIKAANIAIDKKGRARLLDFGLAAVKGDDKLTRTGTTLGTVSYMSP
ncbi:MAG: protein kinase, partial [candidate division Zixibacteria bacterium]|nr:serine/threonine protein kinase [candidate division Zixibacteria bacterium]NIR65375.1 serine/threonine protein kinase [candidate division Zixibacteria bacterium]NIS15168.1 serine/threonine protein kinase [candidate division Zixibacteria bacterium]NIS47066.1 serine/threonine protein kinase [candidate division Zixibacteria bacterium]NIU15205.1 serine/threonine protein kinase [candidate division Zixibacteria bacterium]